MAAPPAPRPLAPRALAALVLLCQAAAPALLGGLTTRHLLATLNDPLPGALAALARHAAPEPPPTPPTGRAVVVLLDGVGEDALLAATRDGAIGPIAAQLRLDTGTPSLSRPGYHALLSGVPPRVSGIRANHFTRGRADSVADRVRAGGGRVAWLLDGVPWLHDIFGVASEPDGLHQGFSLPSFQKVWSSSTSLIVVHLAATDGVAHHEGTQGAAYRAALASELRQVAQLRAVVDASEERERTWLLVGSDHGHRAVGGHGGPEDDVRRVSWLVLGPARPDAPIVTERRPLGALATVVAWSLGVPAPRQALVEAPPLPFFANPEDPYMRPRAQAVREEVEALAGRQRRGVLWRLGAWFVAVAVLAAVAARRGRLWAVAPMLAGWWLFVVAGPGLSLSAVRNEAYYIVRTLLWTALGAAAAWPLARRWGARLGDALLASALWPLTALVASAGSLGAAGLGDAGTMGWAALGMAPSGLGAGLLLAAAAERAVRGVRRRAA